jgi:hypothetical protein
MKLIITSTVSLLLIVAYLYMLSLQTTRPRLIDLFILIVAVIAIFVLAQ